MDYAIVTGATRGLGESIAKLFIEKGIGLINVSRSNNERLQKLAGEKEVSYEFFPCDLAQSGETEAVFREVGTKVFGYQSDRVYIVHNAGVVTPINRSGEVENQALETSVHVNLLSPMISTNEMIKAARGSDSKMIMINISSGAGSRPVHGWSTYCATKAGVNMLTETVSLELSKKHSRHQVIAFSPGVMDTDMQGEIRSSSKEAFADVESFQRYKEEGMLRETDTVANALIKLVTESEIESGKLYHVNDLL
ncbi:MULTISPECIES: (S)-benzoin forming benzil reductase [Rossellomorea]|jgi:benzil reductase ((S)-benzoin forming)|uniref:(S)-benzoin forming benzil reductase n=1 Tax=Rossellomorea aquimaris TaxID=189382 RepID=A0A5D4TQK7_9BACI|nr:MULTISPECIES: (S)-benzoin forming benzil reductase [Rossellomorea]MDT9027543.1 (S)-benzoin forming benzil reductase [Rossellomorea sp. YC4-1]TYS72628.1 (S)-benzoin forming benzil reductase [Rossellomorea aquimaris]TYS77269.1 (S)-benzoin forming benzil reductase [Rossellomorea aquimaris]TYS84936.1 (S)-benzoin forming benzil reductase [Rossellomorea aquimaris]